MNNSDLFLVSRNGISHKVRLDTLRSDVNDPVNQEIADLKQKDIDLDRKIDILQLDVNQNEADSDAADAALDARITALEGEPDVDLSGYATKQQLNNEEAARIAGDNSLDTKITTEANARIAGDNTLGNEIDGVEQRVDTLEGKVDALEAGGGVDLTSYATKTYSDNGDNAVRNEFKAADDDLRSDVVAERAARIAGDSNLQSIIDNTVVRTSGAQTITTAPGESVRFNSAGTNGQPRIQLIRDSGFDYSIQNAQGDLEITRGNVDIYRFAGGDHVWYDLNSDEVMRVGDGDTTITGNLTVTGTINGSSGISGDTVYINVKDFGAVGNGTTDDTTAVRNAMNSASNGDTIYFPAGKYRISSSLTFANKGCRMLGDSQQSILFFVGAAGDNLLELKFDNRNTFWTIENMVFMAASIPGRQFGAGILLEYTGPATVVGGSDYLNLVNVQVISDITTDSQQGWFQRGLWILNAGGVNAVNFTVSSYNLITSATPGTIGISIVNTKPGHSMIRCFHAVNIYIQRYNCCVKSQVAGGTNIESIYLTQGEIVGYRGFEIDAGQATFLSGLHMDCQEVAYQNTSNGGPHRIIGCDIRGGRDSAGSNSNYLIKLGANNTTLSGCDILCQMPNEGVIQVAPFGTQPEAISITGNVIEGKDDPNYRALEVNSGAKNIKYGGNSYRRFGGEGQIVNAAGAELVVYGQRTGNTP